MKKILLTTSAIALLTNTGCIVPEGRGHDHYYHHHHRRCDCHSEVIVRPPVIVVPVVVVRPLGIHVH